jgi:hypothetical protein
MQALCEAHYGAVAAALHKVLELDTWQYPFPVTPDLEAAMTHVINRGNEGNAFVGSGCLLLVSEFTPWFAKDRVLQEELILSLAGPRAGLRAVIRFVEAEAARRGCSYVMSGNTSQDSRLSFLYRRLGFVHMSDIFFKGVNNG